MTNLFSTGYIRPRIGDRVMNKDTRQLGTVTGTCVIKEATSVSAITVDYDNGATGVQIAENEVIKVDKGTRGAPVVQATPAPSLQEMMEEQYPTGAPVAPDNRRYNAGFGEEIERAY